MSLMNIYIIYQEYYHTNKTIGNKVKGITKGGDWKTKSKI